MEILVREAKDLGLDKDDEVIKRRLAQKMDFLFEDVAKVQDPTEAELRAWYTQNSERFAEPPRIAFHHLYFALDHGGSEEQAVAAKARVAGHPPDEAVVKIAAADLFMFQDVYTDATPEQVAKEFGPGFAKAIFALSKGSWQGPVSSGYGWHLVFVDSLVPGSVPRFDEVEPKVKTAWLDDHARELKRGAFEALRARYTVVTPPLDHPALIVPPPAAAAPSP
jgi:parvulin-like peptidyl-prolyl isomerase